MPKVDQSERADREPLLYCLIGQYKKIHGKWSCGAGCSTTPNEASADHNGGQMRSPRMVRMVKMGSSTPDKPRKNRGNGPNFLRRAITSANAQTPMESQ